LRKTPISLPKIGKNCRKAAKNAENCDHNINPWSPWPGSKQSKPVFTRFAILDLQVLALHVSWENF
jgi:hypothetical protein